MYAVLKQLLLIYDRPMIYYPLSVLMLAGIREILIFATLYDQGRLQALLGYGSRFEVEPSNAIQERPNGLAEAFALGANFIDDDSTCLILGDYLFCREGIIPIMLESVSYIEHRGWNCPGFVGGCFVYVKRPFFPCLD